MNRTEEERGTIFIDALGNWTILARIEARFGRPNGTPRASGKFNVPRRI